MLDFFSVEHELAIEVDGGIHFEPIQAEHDAARTEFLQVRGIRVLRFSNEQVEQHLGEVLRQIEEACSK